MTGRQYQRLDKRLRSRLVALLKQDDPGKYGGLDECSLAFASSKDIKNALSIRGWFGAMSEDDLKHPLYAARKALFRVKRK